MIKEIKLAKSGVRYLKISNTGESTILIFETEYYIFEYIYNKIDVYQISEYYNLDELATYCTPFFYFIFKEAFENKIKLMYEYYDDEE